MNIEIFKSLLESKCPNSNFLLVVKRGSHAYGTNIESSDEDFSGVYIQSKEDIFGSKYKEQINDDKNDTVFYEVRRFLDLVASNNPTILELMNTPEDCIIYKHPLYDIILDHSNEFITKVCAKSFGGYAIQQIKKAKGTDKKQNWEKDKVTRKSPLDFCYLHIKENSINLSEFLSKNNLDQKFCGLSKIPHSRDTYALFYDYVSSGSEISESTINSMNFRGISFEDSNDIRLSSIPIDCPYHYFIGHISYNKDGYTQHCNDYKSYQTWLDNRNEQRFVDVKSHGQKIDGKNMMHCRRLLEMAMEIGSGKGIIVRRPNKDELISIRKGEIDLQSLIDRAENDILEINKLFDESNLPESVDKDLVNNILIKIRTEFYKQNI